MQEENRIVKLSWFDRVLLILIFSTLFGIQFEIKLFREVYTRLTPYPKDK